jgi:hypothetical protein
MHLVEEHQQATGPAAAIQRPPQIAPCSRGDGKLLWHYLDGDHLFALERQDRNAGRQRWPGSAGDERSQTRRVSSARLMAWLSTADLTIVLYPYQQPSWGLCGTVG